MTGLKTLGLGRLNITNAGLVHLKGIKDLYAECTRAVSRGKRGEALALITTA